MMCERECKLSSRVAAESADGLVSEELAAHIALCAACGETLRVANLMRAFARATPPNALPAPGLLLWKSRMLERRAAQRRATMPLVVAQVVSIVFAATTLLWWASRNSLQLNKGLANLEPMTSGLLASFNLVATPLLIASICVGLVCVMMMFALRESQANS
jgi:glycerol uptake facilitator-like aquaporin